MPNIEAAHPEDDVFGDIRGVIRDALQMARGQHELHSGSDERNILGHAEQQVLEDAVAVLVHNVVALQNLRGKFGIAKDERAQAAADHRANCFRHRRQFLGRLGVGHFAEGDDAFR